MNASNVTQLRQKDEQISSLESEVARLKGEIVAPVETADMAIQKDEAEVSEIDAEKVYQAALDGMRREIEKLKHDHHEELTRIMVS